MWHSLTPVFRLAVRFRTIILFLISGGTAALLQLLLYAFLTRIIEVWYIAASVVSFVLAVVLSFLLQKFVAFENKDMSATPRQFLFFAGLAVFNLMANVILMILFVEYASIHDILAQAVTMIIVAVWSFFIYRHFIFKKDQIGS